MHITNFIRYLEFEKRSSKHTVLAYQKDIAQLQFYLKEVYDDIPVVDVSFDQLRSWVVFMLNNEMTPSSIHRKVSSIKAFFRYLMIQGKVEHNPAKNVILPKKRKTLPHFVSKDKMQLLLDEFDFGTDFQGKQKKMIIDLFYATGIRLSELINLRLSDFKEDQQTIKVLGKRNQERIIPITTALYHEFITFINERKNIDTNHDYLFLTKKNKKVYEKFVYRIVNNYLSAVSTMKKTSPHVLRHTFATHMLNNGAELNAIKELLGHASLSATEIYTHNSFEKLKSIYKQAHPRA